ncbi:hypothetical protein AB1L88_22255 [Tautonia sp. JC769]|uniref:hypothetical protein n=1 Tax=Tautonia sp. JC769 TaxID=3232135 RepID=UPI003459D98A
MSDRHETLTALLAALGSSDPRRRNAAALRIQEFAEAAVDELCRQVERPENRENRGTLVHVLGTFNCSSRFAELVRWAGLGGYEVQCHALNIMDTHRFAVTPTQLRDAERVLDELRTRDDMDPNDVEALHDQLREILSRAEDAQPDGD